MTKEEKIDAIEKRAQQILEFLKTLHPEDRVSFDEVMIDVGALASVATTLHAALGCDCPACKGNKH